jgi:hypothetical protein
MDLALKILIDTGRTPACIFSSIYRNRLLAACIHCHCCHSAVHDNVRDHRDTDTAGSGECCQGHAEEWWVIPDGCICLTLDTDHDGCIGKNWHDTKTPFRPRANQGSFEKRAAERKMLNATKAKEKELKDEKETERQVCMSQATASVATDCV